MVHAADTMDFFRLGDLAGAVDERARKPALARCAFAVGHEQRVLRELRAPCDHGCEQRRVQRLVRRVTARKRVRGGWAVKARFEALSELRRIQQGEPGVTDLEEDLDEVECKSASNARNSLIIKSWVIGRMVKWWSGWSNVGG